MPRKWLLRTCNPSTTPCTTIVAFEMVGSLYGQEGQPLPLLAIRLESYLALLPYSGKFSLGKNFAKPRCAVLRENFARFIFAHMQLGEIKFHGIINNYSFQRGSLAVSSSLEKCLAAAESPFSLAILTSVHCLATYKALSSPL